jgi:hypothetical protein
VRPAIHVIAELENDDRARENSDFSRENDDLGRENDDLGRENDDLGRENDDLPRENDDLGRENNDFPRENDDLECRKRRIFMSERRTGICLRGRFVSFRSGNVMVDAQLRSAPGKNAKTSRRAGLRAGRLRRHRGEAWIRPFRRTKRAINSTLGLIETSRRVINACETFAGVRPLRATRQLQRVSGWLSQAAARLERGVECLNATTDSIAIAPADAGDAPERLIDATERWIDAAAQIAMLSNRLDETFTRLVAYVGWTSEPLDLSELFKKKRPAPRPIAIRHPSPRVLSIENSRIFCIHIRRQRSARLTVADAPRRIFRGRAPPLVSTCSL